MAITFVLANQKTSLKLQKILHKMRFEVDDIQQFSDPKLNKEYQVFLVYNAQNKQHSILKKSEPLELNVYLNYFNHHSLPVPTLLAHTSYEGETWILLSNEPGQDLHKLDYQTAKNAGTSLGNIANLYFKKHFSDPLTEKYLTLIVERQKKLPRLSNLYKAYSIFIDRQISSPKTLSHSDLLPINVLSDQESATIIDWGYGNVAPYTLDVGRFIAFLSSDMDTYEAGLTFLAEPAMEETFLESYYSVLDASVKELITKKQFKSDVRLECLNQYVECFAHEVDENAIEINTNEWSEFAKYFYMKAKKLAESIIKNID